MTLKYSRGKYLFARLYYRLTMTDDMSLFELAFPESIERYRHAVRELRGLPADPVRYSFSFPVAQWLSRHCPGELSIDWDEFEDVVTMLSEGVSTRRGRRSAHLHRDRVHGRLRGRRGARLAAMTSGGAIPDTADYDVVEEPTGARVGKVNEDFANVYQLVRSTMWPDA